MAAEVPDGYRPPDFGEAPAGVRPPGTPPPVPAETPSPPPPAVQLPHEPMVTEAAQAALGAARDELAARSASSSPRTPQDQAHSEPMISAAALAALAAAREEFAAQREAASTPAPVVPPVAPAVPAPPIGPAAPAPPIAPAVSAPHPVASAHRAGLGDDPDRARSLRVLRDEIGDCTRCPLHTGRNELVFGVGRPTARLMMVADGPGAAEDETALPFVDEAGRLLGRMIRAMGLCRSEVYLTYLVKCRTPGIHPEAGLDACAEFLARQVSIVQPEAIIALGDLAARRVTGRDEAFPRLRGQWFDYRGVPVLPTFHPIALLQNPRSKALVWADLQTVMRRLGLKQPRRG